MRTVKLGKNGPEVSAIGLGCMGMTKLYGAPDPEEVEKTLARAVELGVTMIDTADAYGGGKNEEVVGAGIRPFRDKVFLATKFGNLRTPDGKPDVCGRPDYVIEACDKSLARLGLDHIDLYYQHRVDTDVPIEDTVGAMARLVEQGKVRHIGLSEAAPETIRRAAATHEIAALQTEYSLWTRDVEKEILPLCRELGIAFVAYSPLGRGFLSGTIRDLSVLAEDDRRREHPRYDEENVQKNLALLGVLDRIAEAKGVTPAQIALAWLFTRGGDIIPIPGTKRRTWLEQNVAALDVDLGAEECAALEAVFTPGVTAGDRYPPGQLKRVGL
ncbi:MAG: aldo/keto reductase [Alphaproteobacteria bacterium]